MLDLVVAIGVASLFIAVFIAVIGAGILHGAGLTDYRNSPDPLNGVAELLLAAGEEGLN